MLESAATKHEKLNVKSADGDAVDVRVADPLGAHVTATITVSSLREERRGYQEKREERREKRRENREEREQRREKRK